MRLAPRLLAAVALLGAAAALLWRLAPPSSLAPAVRDGTAPAGVVALAALAAYACLAWLATVLVLVAAGTFPRGAMRDLAERTLGIAAAGAAAGVLAAGPAVAADGPFDRPAGPAPPMPPVPTAADPVPPQPPSGPRRPATGPPVRAHPSTVAPPGPDTVVVAPGDTLWGIAARRLGARASPALVASTWPRWYAANRPRIGPDPGLLFPGQRLVPPNDGGDG